MVRQKNRWLLVKLDFQEDFDFILAKETKMKKRNDHNIATASSSTDFPSKKEILFYIRQNITSCFGIAADGAALDTQGESLNCEICWPCTAEFPQNFSRLISISDKYFPFHYN